MPRFIFHLKNRKKCMLASSSFRTNNTPPAALKEDDARKARRAKLANLLRFCEIFNALDANSDGQVSREEFFAGMKLPEIQEIISSMGLDVADASELFDIIDRDDNGTLELIEFCTGLYRSTGEARGRDLLEVHCDLWKAVRREREEVEGKMGGLLEKLGSMERRLERLCSDTRASSPVKLVAV